MAVGRINISDMKKLIVFATAHNPQMKGDKQNGEIAARLSFLVKEFNVTVIMEEWTYDGSESFPNEFARSSGIAYFNVGTGPEDHFKTFNGPINYPGHDGTLGPRFSAPSMYEYGPLTNQENREKRMGLNIEEAMRAYETGIFIVGTGHVHSMSSKLLIAGFDVTAFSWLP